MTVRWHLHADAVRNKKQQEIKHTLIHGVYRELLNRVSKAKVTKAQQVSFCAI